MCSFRPLPHIFAASKNGCLDIVCPQSSVKINQISLDESGEHVGICSEDGKVSAAYVTDHCPCKHPLRLDPTKNTVSHRYRSSVAFKSTNNLDNNVFKLIGNNLKLEVVR